MIAETWGAPYGSVGAARSGGTIVGGLLLVGAKVEWQWSHAGSHGKSMFGPGWVQRRIPSWPWQKKQALPAGAGSTWVAAPSIQHWAFSSQ